uniref:Transcriptional regulator n=1 Tax=Heterorhabditis bacteriophora TaxID=37862 RepID=A0A1I7X2V9_HETBA
MDLPSPLRAIAKPLINGLIEQVDILRRLSIGAELNVNND